MESPVITALRAEVAQLNIRLRHLAGEMKRLQPKIDGAVTLRFAPCGKGCHGCPHPAWLTWRRRYRGERSGRRAQATRGGGRASLGRVAAYGRPGPITGEGYFWLGYRIAYPLKSLRRGGRFAQNYPQVKAIVQEALGLQKRRAQLLAESRRLSLLLG